jgi:hypothetical protein
MGKSKAKPGAKPQSGGSSSTPEGLTVVKAGDGGSTDLHATLIKAGAAAQKPGASADDRRTMIVHCVNNAGAMSADVEDRLGLFWAQSARDAWTQHASDDQEEPLGEIQMTKLKKTAAEGDDGVAGKLWLINAIAYESVAAKNIAASSLGKLSTAAFESAMGMVAAIAKVRKAAVVLALVTRPKRADTERQAMLRIVAQQLLAKKVHVVVYEIAAADEDADEDEEEAEEQYTTKTTKKTKAKPPVRGDDADGSGSDTEDMDDDAMEELFKSKGKSKPPISTKKSHTSVKPSPKPANKATKAKAEEGDSGSDTEDMELDVDAAKKLVGGKRAPDAVAKDKRKPSESESDTEEMDMEDIKPRTTAAVASTTKTKPVVRQGDQEDDNSGSDTEEMDVELEKAKAAKAKAREEVVVVATPAKRARAETARPLPQKRKKARREESEEEKRKKEERRVGRLLRGVGVVFGAGAAGRHDAEAERKLAELIKAMGGTVSEVVATRSALLASTHAALTQL